MDCPEPSTIVTEYRPQQRTVAVRVLTDAGWLAGAMTAPQKRSLADSLTQAPNMLSMIDTFLPDYDVSLPYFALRTQAAHMVLLETTEHLPEASGTFVRATPKDVVVLIGNATVSGTAMVPQNLRVSDYFTRQRGFVSLSGATLRIREAASRQAMVHQCPEILVNCERMVGVAEIARVD